MREGDQFGSYLLEERIAVGGMAEIFRARRVGAAGFARQVCIKRILPTLCSDASFVAMFVDEARTGAQLRHGNIVAIDDFGEVAGQYFLCMELVSGVDLARLLRTLARDGKACPTELALYVIAEVLKALDYAHRKVGADGKPLGVVHRDVSPHNVLVSFAGEVKLTDFGIAKAASRLHQTVGRVVKGKLAYMAPEQLHSHAVDGRADLFALGVMLFEALAGRRPFVGANEAEVVHATLRGQRPALRALRPGVPPAVEAFVDKLLEGDPARRFASAGVALGAVVELPSVANGARMLAGVLSHYFPGRASSVQGEGWFSPAMLPTAITPAGHNQLLAEEAAHDTDREIGEAPTLISDVLEARLASDPTGTEATLAGAATVASTPPEFDPAVLGGALPATQLATGTHVLPLEAPRGARPPAVSPRETSPYEVTRTMVAPASSDGAPDAPRETALAGADAALAGARPTAPRPAETAPGARVGGGGASARVPVALAVVAVLATAGAAAFLWLGGRGEPREDAPTPPLAAVVAGVPDATPAVAPATRDAGALAPGARAGDNSTGAAAPAVDAGAAGTRPDAALARIASSTDAGVAEPPAVATGALEVSAIPWANVAIDGRPRGQSPVELRVRAGRHTVELTYRGETRRRGVTVRPGGRARLSVRFGR